LIKAMIVCPVRLYCDALADVLDREDGLAVVGCAQDLDSAFQQACRASPDIVLVDTSYGDVKGIGGELTQCEVIAVGRSEVDACGIGKAPLGYLPQSASIKDAIEALQRTTGATAEPGRCLPRPNVLARSRREGVFVRNDTYLTKRELEVLALINRGLSNGEIGNALTIELATVKNHVHSILQKLGVQRRTQATAWFRSRAARFPGPPEGSHELSPQNAGPLAGAADS
jgi:two-component system, NarL family, nitrate/nitrite response regulator NarL